MEAIDLSFLPEGIAKKVREWLSDRYDEAVRQEIRELVEKRDREELMDRFFMDLEFGTAGLRGKMGAGTNRMNIYNVRMATQGLANYLKKTYGKDIYVVVGYDTRRNSRLFAEETAKVLSANGIKVYLFGFAVPTPLVSYAVRKKKAQAGVVITASHNPPEYNGYKVIGKDGGQIVSPEDKLIIEEVRNVSIENVKVGDLSNVEFIGKDVINEYIEDMKKLVASINLSTYKDVSVVYTPIHGTGLRTVPKMLLNLGFTDIYVVAEQCSMDGSFSTVKFPNPEEPEALEKAINLAKDIGADIVVGTDPDADRMRIGENINGKIYLYNGNQIGALLTYFILSVLKENNSSLLKNGFIVKTIVTTDLIKAIAEDFGVRVEETLTGFKYIGEKIRVLQEEKKVGKYIFGCEESYGYLFGDIVRDKDATNAVSTFLLMASYYYSKNKKIYDVLMDLYKRYGIYVESQKSVVLEGVEGAEKIKMMMERLRKDTPKMIMGKKLLRKMDVNELYIEEYDENGNVRNRENIDWLPKSNVIGLWLEGGLKVLARPSGTEPKIKFYFSTVKKCETENIEKEIEIAEQLNKRFMEEFLALFSDLLK